MTKIKAINILSKEIASQVQSNFYSGAMSSWYGVPLAHFGKAIALIYGGDEITIQGQIETKAEKIVKKWMKSK